MEPFAHKYRPLTLDDFVGQSHLVGKDKIINKLLENSYLPNMIFYGPPGIGKTTLATIIARQIGFHYVEFNATKIGIKDIKEIITNDMIENHIIFIDEFHLLNKKQQQVLLDATEKGSCILIASTTENPYFSIYKAILSRSTIFEFKPLSKDEIYQGLSHLIDKIKIDYKKEIILEDNVLTQIASSTNGDFRSAINLLELVFYKNLSPFENQIKLQEKDVKELAISSSYNYDKDGDSHYDTLSAFHKSLRGSDANASIYYLARLLKGGDLISITRRLLCVASEDVGLANPNAIEVVKNCVDSALQLGLPEARIPLAEATIFLALQPKSNSAIIAIDKALQDVNNGKIYDIPNHLKDSHYNGANSLNHGKEYQYPHNFENHYVEQQYLPNELKDITYYEPNSNKLETAYKNYWDLIKGECK